jgi:hypothetical protein
MAAAVLSFAAKIAININTYGSTDALLWATNLQSLHDSGALALYRGGTILRDAGGAYHSEIFNHPPFMIHLLSWWGGLADLSGLPLRFWMRLTCAAGDLASVFLLLGILFRRRIPFHPAALLLAVASPVSLMVSGFHGNTDPIMVALLLLSLYLLETGPAWLAGAALGMAVNIKIVPLLFAPAIFLFLRGKKRVEFAGGAAAMFVVCSLPVLAQDPTLVWKHVFGYSPQSGMWGLSALILGLGTDAGFQVYTSIAKAVLLGLVSAASIWMNWGERRLPPLVQCGFLALLLLAMSPGFGVQYLAWLVPWTCLLRFREALAFHVAGGVLLFVYYTRASQGFPWYMANSAKTPVWNESLILLGLVCWLVICCLVILFGLRLRKTSQEGYYAFLG